MDDRTFKTLDLEALVALLARHVQTPLGRKRALSLLPSTDRDQITIDLDRTTECANYLVTGGTFGLSDVDDPEGPLAELHVAGTSLEPLQILALQRLVAAGMDVREQFSDPDVKGRYPQLTSIALKMPDIRRILASIRGKILPNGEIDDNASPVLRRIRREISERRNRIYRNLEALMHERSSSAIQEDIVTIRNGRFVIPVRTDSRSQVPGVMHGLSSSGQTTFVEPLTIIDQNNELVRLREEEEIEISRILLEITETFRTHVTDIAAIKDGLTELDFTHAKARLAAEFDCVRPELIDGGGLLLQDARHLLLEHSLKQAGSRAVPISFEMDESHQTMVISGPNAGGKTVVIKTVGLIALMAQSGLHVPATRAVLPVFAQVLADIGDQQSIAANLSTFTAHMRNIAEMSENVSPPALILLDEVGTGTDPDEGAALGVSIVDFFHRAGATTIATTHYNPLKVWASQADGVLNASVEFDEVTLKPTYRLIVGVAGASSGLEIARRMELPDEIISQANALLDPSHTQASDYLKQLKKLVDDEDALRAALEEERQATADKYARLDLDFAQREVKRQQTFESELARVIREFTAEGERLLKTVGDRVTAARLKKETEARAAELRRSAAVRLRKQFEPVSANTTAAFPTKPGIVPGKLQLDTEEIRERDRVKIRSLDREGFVESISDGIYTILIGSLRFRANRDEIQLISAAEAPKSRHAAALPRGVSADVSVDQDFTTEINVIGNTVDEATDRVDKFLDEAFLAGAETVRIVHGHGKGALRKAIAELLTGHTHVERFNSAPANEGGAGATIAALKK
ncbi:MAG TPA: Smr/MutS family protein [Blastocatellia bacterium]|nr:Smr/MutS family protein [Blastocatellia bacterium]